VNNLVAVEVKRSVKIWSFLLILALIGGFLFTWEITFFATFFLAVISLLFARREIIAGLSLLWAVRLEPAPADLVFLWGWFKNLLKPQLQFPSTAVLRLFFLFIILNLLQMPLSVSWSRALVFAGVTVYTIMLSFFVSSIIEYDVWEEARDAYIIATLIAVLPITILSLPTILGTGSFAQELYVSDRPAGFFKDPNVAGAFITTGLTYFLGRVIFLKRSLLGLDVVVSLIVLTATVLTFSRGAILNSLVCIIVLGLVSILKRRGWRFVLVFALILIATTGLFLPLIEIFGQESRFDGEPEEYDLYGRSAAWESGLLMVRDFPLGFGPGQFEVHSPDYQSVLPGQIIPTGSAHSLYIRLLAENGPLGLASLLIAFFLVILRLIRLASVLSPDYEPGFFVNTVWLLSTFVGIIAESFVIDTLHWRHFWVIIGFALSWQNILERRLLSTS
jgi:O-antigen ligase